MEGEETRDAAEEREGGETEGREKELNPVFDLHQLQIHWEEGQTEGTRQIKREEASVNR